MPKSIGDVKATVEPSKLKNSKEKKRGTLVTLLTILAVIVVIIVVFGGVFYFIIYSNINGVAEHYRSSIQNIPLLKNALPEPPDLLDPKYMTERDVKKKYVEFRDQNDALKKQLAEANGKLIEYQVYKDDYENMKLDVETKLQEIKERNAALEQKELQLKEEKQKLDELVANGDKESFKLYYETVDPENAKLLFDQIVKEQQVDANIKKFAQVYEVMDAAAAATIFEELGDSKMDMTVETLKAMKKENSSAILESMAPEFAAKVTEELNALFKGN